MKWIPENEKKKRFNLEQVDKNLSASFISILVEQFSHPPKKSFLLFFFSSILKVFFSFFLLRHLTLHLLISQQKESIEA